MGLLMVEEGNFKADISSISMVNPGMAYVTLRKEIPELKKYLNSTSNAGNVKWHYNLPIVVKKVEAVKSTLQKFIDRFKFKHEHMFDSKDVINLNIDAMCECGIKLSETDLGIAYAKKHKS